MFKIRDDFGTIAVYPSHPKVELANVRWCEQTNVAILSYVVANHWMDLHFHTHERAESALEKLMVEVRDDEQLG